MLSHYLNFISIFFISYLFYTYWCIYVNPNLRLCFIRDSTSLHLGTPRSRGVKREQPGKRLWVLEATWQEPRQSPPAAHLASGPITTNQSWVCNNLERGVGRRPVRPPGWLSTSCLWRWGHKEGKGPGSGLEPGLPVDLTDQSPVQGL